MYGVLFNDTHSLNDLGMYLKKKVIHEPDVQTNFVKVPQRDGAIDLTESLTGQVKYNNRLIELEFTLVDRFDSYPTRFSVIANFLHGKKMKIIFDDDNSYFYIGRLTVTASETEKSLGIIKISADCEPYKYDLIGTDEDWLWDPFDFEDGIIQEFVDILIDGTETIGIIAKRQVTYPTIITDTAMKVTFLGVEHDLLVGENKMYDILLTEGENSLIFNGHGTISIRYRGGSL